MIKIITTYKTVTFIEINLISNIFSVTTRKNLNFYFEII